MKNATVMNDNVQEIRKILEEYLGNRKAAKVAVELSTVIQGEIKYNDNGEVFFVHKDKEGKLVLTTESVVKRNVQTILQSYLEEDELQECIESLMAEKHETEETEKPETNKVSNSDTPVHTEEPIKHEPKPSNVAIKKPMTENYETEESTVKKASFMNDDTQEIQRIRKILEKYLSNQEAEKVALELFTAMQGIGEPLEFAAYGGFYFRHKSENGIRHDKESLGEQKVYTILKSYIKENKIYECMEYLFVENYEAKKIKEDETILIPGSDDPMYKKLLAKIRYVREELLEGDLLLRTPGAVTFYENLKEAVSKSVKKFEVFVCDPSMEYPSLKTPPVRGTIRFVPGRKPLEEKNYDFWETAAKYNGLRLGTKDEYILFLGWLINSLIKEGWSEQTAWDVVCIDSREIGFYDYPSSKSEYCIYDSFNGNYYLATGAKKVAGKCDLAGLQKILAKDEETGKFFVASGAYNGYEFYDPLSYLMEGSNFFGSLRRCTGWLVRSSSTAN